MSDSMRLSELIKTISPRRITGQADTEVTSLHYDSRKVAPGGAFFALPGEVVDGHDYIDQALAHGAGVIFLQQHRQLPDGVTGVEVDNVRQAMGQVAAAFFGNPTEDIPVVGVTGTNGKTTVTYLVESVLRAAGKRPAVFGTINYRFGGNCLPALHTTPESIDLLAMMADFRKAGADALVMEVSSHALEQYRVEGVNFNVGVFTNLTPEHLDYHGAMESYYQAKTKLFRRLDPVCGRAVVNLDDPYGQRLAGELSDVLSCGTTNPCLVRPEHMKMSLAGIEARVTTPQGPLELKSALLGQFNLQNLLCAAAAGLALGLEPHLVATGLNQAVQVPGRLERIENDLGALVLVDYAHTGDALEKALAVLAELQPRRIISVFGCGGDRDRSKRPVMGEIGTRISDLAILTSDNPRTEDPVAILAEVREGARKVKVPELSREEALSASGKGFIVVKDRREAIDLGVRVLRAGDLLLVAGKGHEDYQILGTERRHFDDREELRRALAQREGSL